MDKKKKMDTLKDELKSSLAKLDAVDIEELTDEDLEDVAGGCSVWCCSAAAEEEVSAE